MFIIILSFKVSLKDFIVVESLASVLCYFQPTLMNWYSTELGDAYKGLNSIKTFVSGCQKIY